MHVALKSSKSKGSIYLLNSLVIIITWWSHTENLLNISEWVSVSSSINAPGSNGGSNGFYYGLLFLFTKGLKFSWVELGF